MIDARRCRQIGFCIRSEQRFNAAEEALPHSPLENANRLEPSIFVSVIQPFLEVFPFAFQEPGAKSCFHENTVDNTLSTGLSLITRMPHGRAVGKSYEWIFGLAVEVDAEFFQFLGIVTLVQQVVFFAAFRDLALLRANFLAGSAVDPVFHLE